ncbi:hypothetical protein DVH24_012157 [Malus domestica]|uniref:Uncharacterized protein n=1 Tax=Malus domestica TaxID=3750 RepID=A0A498HUB2_MALDO|nr:hypothetical protein DVH24_012157 [Malus domestica]
MNKFTITSFLLVLFARFQLLKLQSAVIITPSKEKENVRMESAGNSALQIVRKEVSAKLLALVLYAIATVELLSTQGY